MVLTNRQLPTLDCSWELEVDDLVANLCQTGIRSKLTLDARICYQIFIPPAYGFLDLFFVHQFLRKKVVVTKLVCSFVSATANAALML